MLKDFIKGATRAFDIGATLSGKDYLKVYKNPAEADYRALQSDWKQVGRDLQYAMAKYDAERSK